MMTQTHMKTLAVLILAALLIGISVKNNLHAAEPDDRTVYTAGGVVQFVPPSVSVDALTNLLFPQPKRLTRSLFDAENDSEIVPVSVAMLIRFEFDSDILTADAKVQLDSIGNMLNQGHLNDRGLIVEGHTDIVGTEDYNMGLSMRRAISVKQYLITEHNIESDRLDTYGKGEDDLIDLDNPKGSVNRRVQFAAS